MDDEQKRAVVNTGATVIALGALSKVGVGVIKGAGDFVEGLGVISDKLPIIADATSAIKVSTAGVRQFIFCISADIRCSISACGGCCRV